MRALFGDFNMPEIVENSKNLLNPTLFLIYLFVAVFIILALFLSISRDGREAPKLPWRALSAHQWKVGELWRLVTSTLGASRRVFLPKSLPLFGSLETY